MNVLIAAPSLLNPDACFVFIFFKSFFFNLSFDMDRRRKISETIDFDWLECGGGGSLFFSSRVSYHALKGKTTYLVSMRHFCEF